MMKLSGLTTAVVGATVTMMLVQPRVAALSASQVAETANQITVLIEGQNPGSGVLIKREGNTYTVLTAKHVVATPDDYQIVTPDGQRAKLSYSTVKPLPGVDLAVLTFTSPRSYTVAKLGNARSAPSGTQIYVAGFPVPTAVITESIFNFTEGKMTANAGRPLADGYALVYSNSTLPGMSGGPVLNETADVIGIHGRGDTDSAGTQETSNPDVVVKTGFNLAIPINTFLNLSEKVGVAGFVSPGPAPNSGQMTADDFFLQATAKYEKKDFRGAIADLTQVIRLSPKFATAYSNRGVAHDQLGDRKRAIADYGQAIRLDPNSANAYYNRALAYVKSGDRKAALADLDQTIRLNPNLSEAYNNRGLVRYGLGDHKGALTDLDQVVRLSPNSAEAYNNRGNVRDQLGDRKGAVTDYDQAIRLDPSNANAYYNRGLIRYGSGDPKGALADYDQAIRLKPGNANAYYSRGTARYRSGDRQGALADLDQAIRLSPNSADAYSNRGNVRDGLGDPKGAIADYDQAIRLDPKYAKAYYNRGIARDQLGDQKGAIADFQKAAALAQAQGDQQVYEAATTSLKRLQP
jgi:tetratricopeptide (TPR) repeat protein